MRSNFVERNLVRILILTVTLLPAYRQSASGEVRFGSMLVNVDWYADLYPDNRAYVRVTIDARNLPRNTHFTVNSIEIICTAAGGRSVTRKYTPADFKTQFSGLDAGEVYQGFFRHSCATAKSITGKLIHIHEHTLGVKGGEPRMRKREAKRPITEEEESGEEEDEEGGKPSYVGQPPREKPLNIIDQDITVLANVPPRKKSRRKL